MILIILFTYLAIVLVHGLCRAFYETGYERGRFEAEWWRSRELIDMLAKSSEYMTRIMGVPPSLLGQSGTGRESVVELRAKCQHDWGDSEDGRTQVCRKCHIGIFKALDWQQSHLEVPGTSVEWDEKENI